MTSALGISPASSSGLPKTAQSATAGCWNSAASTSRGGDGEALVFDHLFLAVNDVDVSLIVDARHVAGRQPAVAQHEVRFFGRLPVALHDVRAFDEQLADAAGAQLLLAGGEIDDLLFLIRHSQADRIELHAALVDGVQVRHRGGFRQAVPLQYAHAGFFLHALAHVGRQGRRPDHDVAHGREVELVDVLVVVQGDHDGRHGVIEGDLVLLRQGQREFQVERLHDDQGGAGVDAAAHQHHAVDVVEGQEDEQGVALRYASAGDELDVVGHQVLLAQHDALGQAGGAAGVGQGHQVLGPVQRHLRRVLRRRGPDEVAKEVRFRLGLAPRR